MERFAWLAAQKRWIQPWQGCRACCACHEARFLFCHRLQWFFQGHASFHLNDKTTSSSSHLFFLTTHSTLSSDPAQLALRLGLVMKDEAMGMQDLAISNISGRERVILLFDNSHPFALEIPQVDSISFCSQDTPCSCQTDEVSRKEGSECIHSCGCQQVPCHITLNLRHVALNVYADEQFKETFWNTTSLSQVMEILDKSFLEQRQIHLIDKNGTKDEENRMKQAKLPFEARDAINQGHMLLNKYLNDIDCICECTMKVVEVCSADPPWMGRMLNVMAQHAGNQSFEPDQLKTLKASLLQRLEELREREKLELEKTWGANSHHIIQQQQMQDSATYSFKYLKQEREFIEEALLETELLSTALAT